MRYVGYDHFRRRPAEARGPVRQSGGLLMPSLLLACVALLVLSRMDHGSITSLRATITEVTGPVLRAMMVPLEPLRASGAAVGHLIRGAGELERLASENQRLKGWEARANDLERQLGELGAAAKAARDIDLEFATARVMATSAGPFARSAVINAGSDERLVAGYPVLVGDGLAGRIDTVGNGVSRIMLITHADSRIPVFVGPAAVIATLVGDDGSEPRLAFASSAGPVVAGDEVVTSGAGGLFPRGIRIGTVRDTGERPRVSPHADLDRLEYVSVVFYPSLADNLRPPERLPDAGGSP